jgi:hypothetical protein
MAGCIAGSVPGLANQSYCLDGISSRSEEELEFLDHFIY